MYNRPLKMASELTERTFMNPIVDFLFEGRMLKGIPRSGYHSDPNAWWMRAIGGQNDRLSPDDQTESKTNPDPSRKDHRRTNRR